MGKRVATLELSERLSNRILLELSDVDIPQRKLNKIKSLLAEQGRLNERLAEEYNGCKY